MKITVFTPTYNRAYSLPRLYDSLKKQKFKDFEWVVVNDGSTDNTEAVLREFISENPFFPIKYRRTENGGKHRAINRGMDLVDGELFYIVDSDDWLPEDALQIIVKFENSIPDNDKSHFAGICGLKCNADGKFIGTTFCGDFLDISTLEKKKHSIHGDRAEVYYSSVIRKYPFPEIDGEKFATESLVWDKISYAGYKLRYFNKNVYLCEYLDDGLTKKGLKLYADNPVQWAMSITQERAFGKTSGYALSIQYYKFYLCEKSKYTISEMANLLKISTVLLFAHVTIQQIIDLLRTFLHRSSIAGEITQR